MAESNYKAFSVTEWLVLVIVLFATFSFQPEQDDPDEIEYIAINNRPEVKQESIMLNNSQELLDFYSNQIFEVYDKPIMSMYEKDTSSSYLVA